MFYVANEYGSVGANQAKNLKAAHTEHLHDVQTVGPAFLT